MSKHLHQRTHFRSFLLHFRPRAVPERTLRFTLTWGLGGMAMVLVLLLIATGLMLKFVYEPFPDRAYDSILYLNSQVPFGQLLRNIHWWSANALILVAFLHLLRVFYTGAFVAPRQLNWVIGLLLMAAVVLSNYTGYLLPWDQVAFWAITISTSMLDYLPGVGEGIKQWILGGAEAGPQTLVNFYAIHTAILPTLLLFALPFHFWRVRKAQGLVIPKTTNEDPQTKGEMVDSMPHLIMREVSMALLLCAIILLLAMFFNAPLTDQANPGLSPNPTKAPWYFMGIQELLMHFHPVFAILLIPLALLLGLLALPLIRYDAVTSGVWFASARGRRLVLVAMVLAMIFSIGGVLLDEYVLPAQMVGPPGFISTGLLPFGLILALAAGFYLLARKVLGANINEAVQALFTLLITAFVTLTLIGVWFRGTGMQLMWTG
ncbi:MAG: cytochrome b N-terminal domain-containing protein [Xanthomonadales bacterium]|nr:cytochrome b N-terminal domain-containing protein [Xanthomonadales bacterium]